jgi:hypothetical protein
VKTQSVKCALFNRIAALCLTICTGIIISKAEDSNKNTSVIFQKTSESSNNSSHGEFFKKFFPFIFEETLTNSDVKVFTFQLKRVDNKTTYNIKINEAIPDTDFPGYKVIKYQEIYKTEDELGLSDSSGKTLNVSELTLQKEGEPHIVLKRGRSTCFPYLFEKLADGSMQKTNIPLNDSY